MWVGTKMGLVRFYPDGKHSLRFSRRWLMDDHVNDICFDPKGNAWIATEQGVSAIRTKQMSLVSKEQYFYDVLMGRHIREPWIAGQCHLMAPGDTTQWRAEDDDNDGEFTGNYLSMESFRYAASKNEDAREKAKKAFHFLKTLKDITGGDGYFARSIVPVHGRIGCMMEIRFIRKSRLRRKWLVIQGINRLKHAGINRLMENGCGKAMRAVMNGAVI